MHPGVHVRALAPPDRDWADGVVAASNATPVIVSRGALWRPSEHQGFVAEQTDGTRVGLVTYRTADDECEVLTLDALVEDMGVGTALLVAVRDAAARSGVCRVWLITTNDNTAALRFYQKRGWEIVAVHRRAIEASRRSKPEIPAFGNDGIPIRDEIELELILDRDVNSS